MNWTSTLNLDYLIANFSNLQLCCNRNIGAYSDPNIKWTEGLLGVARSATPTYIRKDREVEVEYIICRGAKPPSEVLRTQIDGILGAL